MDVSESLNISYNTAKSYISIIKERWASYSTIDELQAKRQKLIRRTEDVIKEAWILRSIAKNNLEAIGALRTVLMAVDKLERLQGINTLPLPIEKPRVTQMFELAQKANSLPKNDRDKFLLEVKKRISARKKIES